MPIRLLPLLVPIIATTGSFFSGLAAIAEGGPGLSAGIIDNNALLFVCLVGSVGGALVSLIFFPPKTQSVQYLAAKFLGSSLVSAMFAPLTIQYFSPTPRPELVLAVSGAMSLFSVWVIRIVKQFMDKKAESILGVKDDEDDQTSDKK